MATKPRLNNFLQLKQKLHGLKADLYFLSKCRKLNIFPNFIKLKCGISNERSRNALNAGKRKWLNNEIHFIYAKLSTVELNLYDLHLSIIKSLTAYEFDNWLIWLNETNNKIISITKRKKMKLNKKLRKLKTLSDNRKSKALKPLVVDGFVKNLSSKTFSDDEMMLLNKGLNFSLHPKELPLDNIIVDIESAIEFLPDRTKKRIQDDIVPILASEHHINAQNQNRAYSIIKLLNKKECVYTKADKGNSLVILDKIDYINRGQKLIDEGTYTKLPRSPLNNMVKKVTQVLKNVNDEFGYSIKSKLIVSNPTVPKMYFLPKIHKPGDKVRPIVSNIGAPTYRLAKWVLAEIKKLPLPASKSVKNSFGFVEVIKDTIVEEDEIMVSFDVVSLFPSVPVKLTLDWVKEWLVNSDLSDNVAEVLYDAVKICMEQNHFEFNKNYYHLVEGTSMGNPLSPWIADFFMSRLETDLEKLNKLPKGWCRYVDDVWAVVKKCEVQNTLDMLNELYPSIKFTVDEEVNASISFLDLKLTRNLNVIDIDIFRKETSTSRFITSDSFCPTQHKMAAFNSMLYRMVNLPLSETNFDKELACIKNIAVVNGYAVSKIDHLLKKHIRRNRRNSLSTMFNVTEQSTTKYIKMTYFPSITNKLRNIFNRHDMELVYNTNTKLTSQLFNGKVNTTDKLSRSGIYMISCPSYNCNKVYVGQCRRQIKTRFKEHLAHLKNNTWEKSAVAGHILDSSHKIDITNLKLLKEVNDYRKLNSFESLFMYKFNDRLMNVKPAPIESVIFDLSRSENQY